MIFFAASFYADWKNRGKTVYKKGESRVQNCFTSSWKNILNAGLTMALEFIGTGIWYNFKGGE
jgi:hypothetical protein